MLEALVAATAASGLIVLARGQRGITSVVGAEWIGADDGEDDLPCPWCYSPTASSDSRCPSCDRRFG